MQSQIEVDKEDLFTIKINCKGKRTVGKANKWINIERIIRGLKKLIKKRAKKGRLHRTAKEAEVDNNNKKCNWEKAQKLY